MFKERTSLRREAHFEVKTPKAPHVRTTFGLRRRKSARPRGAKHIRKSKVLKTDGPGPHVEKVNNNIHTSTSTNTTTATQTATASFTRH